MRTGMVQTSVRHSILIVTSCRFADGDTFARFSGIGIGCQRFQSHQVLNIQVGPDYTADVTSAQLGGGDLVEPELSESDDDIGGN